MACCQDQNFDMKTCLTFDETMMWTHMFFEIRTIIKDDSNLVN